MGDGMNREGKPILAVAITQQNQIDVLLVGDIGKRSGDKFEIGFRIKQGPKSNEAQRITLHYGNADRRLFGRRSFHSGGSFHSLPVCKLAKRSCICSTFKACGNSWVITPVTWLHPT